MWRLIIGRMRAFQLRVTAYVVPAARLMSSTAVPWPAGANRAEPGQLRIPWKSDSPHDDSAAAQQEISFDCRNQTRANATARVIFPVSAADHVTDFIEVYENAVDLATCRSVIERFHASDRIARGAMGGGVDTTMKNSWDISIGGDKSWSDAEGVLNRAMLKGLLAYLRKYPYTILGPVWLRMRDPASGASRLLDPESLSGLEDMRLQALAMKAFRPGSINIQRYIADEGGYPRWHCEIYPKAGDADALFRTLLWTIYLNDGFGEGETEFFHQRRKIAPKTGSLLIAPASFTHTHRGNVPRRADKYIATSWVLFQRPEALYATAAPGVQ